MNSADFVKIAKPYIGAKKGSKLHHDLVDTFNKKHPNGEYGNYTCAYCAITDTALSLKMGYTDKEVPMSYNCGTIITLAKKLGIWVEDDNYLPKVSDSIIYSWSDKTGSKSDCKSGASHIGRVWFVRGNDFIIFEGNMGSGYVGLRHIKRNQIYIRGYVNQPITIGTPDYSITADGDWGVQTDFLTQVVMNVAVDLEVGKNTWKAIQKTIGLTGKNVDGEPGSTTYKTMSRFLGIAEQSSKTKTLVKAWQNWLNAQVKPIEKKKYDGKLPALRVSKTATQVANDSADWAVEITKMNDFHYGEGGSSKKDFGQDVFNITHSRGCYYCNGNEKKVAKIKALKRSDLVADHWKKTYVCNPFVYSSFVHGGLVPSMKCKDNGALVFLKSLFKVITKPAKANLKKGDVLLKYVDGKFKHASIYIGSGKIAEASSYKGKYGSDASNNSIRVKTLTDANYKAYTKVCRFNSSINADVVIKMGEYSNRVGEWQDFLNWYTNGEFFKKCGARDNFFGDDTKKYTISFQSENGLDPDAEVGVNTLKKAGEVEC